MQKQNMTIGFEPQTLADLDAMTADVRAVIPSVSRAAVIRWSVKYALEHLKVAFADGRTDDVSRLAMAIAAHQPAIGAPSARKQGTASKVSPRLQRQPELAHLASVASTMRHNPVEAREALAELLPHMQAMRQEGYTMRRISDEIGVAKSTVSLWLARAVNGAG